MKQRLKHCGGISLLIYCLGNFVAGTTSFVIPATISLQHPIQMVPTSTSVTPSHPPLVDIGINLTHASLKKHWREVVQRALDQNVNTILLTGTSVKVSRECLEMARTWHEETRKKNLFVTVGVHPHDAKHFQDETDGTIDQLRDLLQDEFAVSVGECGLDFNRNFSSRDQQIHAFREQVKLACELQPPLFLHEREAHNDLIKVLDEVEADNAVPPLPPIVVHCFTGTKEEALEYIRRGYFLGFTGTICKKERGAPLRDILLELPIEQLMVETDAPWMGFKKGQRFSEPAHVVDVARQLGDTMEVPHEQVCQITTETALRFFRIPEA